MCIVAVEQILAAVPLKWKYDQNDEKNKKNGNGPF